MGQQSHTIKKVALDSPAFKAGLKKGDILISIDGHPLKDIFDWYYYSDEPSFEIEINRDGSNLFFTIKNENGEELGIEFENGLLDDYKSCSNKCIFCFIDQMPPGMRDTLYFKDDDTRLSFLQGNYVTLTNMKETDIDRVINYRLAPINVSVHTTNPTLRCEMLKNRFAGDIVAKMRRIADADLSMNAQIVLCRGINDGDELTRTLNDLFGLYPHLQSVSVVPVGLTKYREGLFQLEPFDRESAGEVLDLIEGFQRKAYKKHGEHFVHASDEWYIMAGRSLPKAFRYDGYPQLENGVGMIRLLTDEFKAAVDKERPHPFIGERRLSIATGFLAGEYIRELCRYARIRFPGVKAKVYRIKNNFFGDKVTVSGLITGGDLIEQLKGKDLGSELLIPVNMLRAGETVFLDDVSVKDVSDALQVRVVIVKSEGKCLLDALLGKKEQKCQSRL